MIELKYKIGDEVLVKGVVKDTAKSCNYADKDRPYWVVCPGGNGVWVPEDDVYDNAYIDTWKLAGEIVGMPYSMIEEIFGEDKDYMDIFEMSPNEVREKIHNHYNSKPRIGDVVECSIADIALKGILIGMNGEGFYWVLIPNESSPRKIHTNDWVVRKVEDCKIDIAKALEEIK